MIVKKILISAGFLFVFLVSFLNARAYDAPRIYIKELNISGSNFRAGDAISGDFNVWNSTDGVLTNLNYSISLRISNAIFKEEVLPFSYSIKANEKIKQNFSFIIPTNIRTDEYDLRVQFFTESGTALSWEDKKISIKGNEISLYLSDVSLLKGGTDVNPSRGENFSPDIAPQVKFTVTNSSEQVIIFSPSISIYNMRVGEKELKKISLPEESLASGERKEIVAELAQFTEPTSYLGKISLLVNSETVSNIGEFRWVVEGYGARVTNITTDKNSYEAGEEIKITVDLVGPADNSDIGEGKLIIAIFDPQGKIMATEEKNVKLNSGNAEQTFNFIANSALVNPRIEAKIFKGEQELNNYIINQEKQEKSFAENSDQNTNTIFIGILLLAAAILILIFVAIKYLKNKGILAILIAIGIVLSGSFINKAEAFTFSTTWNKPVPNPLPEPPYNPGDAITFQGAYASYACSNEISDIKVSSYICDKNEEHCASTGNYYSAWLNGLAYDSVNKKIYASNSMGNSVLRLDFNAKNVEQRYGMGETQAGEFNYPWDTVFVSSLGYIYASDSAASRLIRFKPGDEEGTWEELGGLGSDIGQFDTPKGLYYDSSAGYLYVADSRNSRIVRFKPSDAVWTNSWESFGSYGSGNGHFKQPHGVSFDSVGKYVYVGDSENYRIVRFKPTDNGSGGYTNWRFFGDGLWGSGASDNNSFRRPGGIYYSPASKYVYVVEEAGYAITMFKPDDADWTSTTARIGHVDGSGQYAYSQDPGGFTAPSDIFYDAGYIYVTDSHMSYLVKFQQGDQATAEATWDTYGSQGIKKGRLNFPMGFFYDTSTGYMYIADSNNKRIVKFDYDGSSGSWYAFGSVSDLEGSFNKPSGVFYDTVNGQLYVADSNNSRVVRFTPNTDGTFSNWDSWGSYGSGDEQFIQPVGIYYDESSDFLYVSDSGRNQIIKFRPQAGGNIGQWSVFGGGGSGVGQFKEPSGIYYDSASGFLYAADKWNSRIARFKPSDAGAPVNDWKANWQSYGNGWGSGIGQFEMPMNVYYDATAGQEYLYAADFANGRVVRFKPDDYQAPINNWKANWKAYGTVGQGGGQFQYVAGVYYDAEENYLYVADSNRGGFSNDNTRIARFDPNGNTAGNFAGNWDTMDMSFREYLINSKVPLIFEPGFTLGANGLARAKIVVEGFMLFEGRTRTFASSFEDIYLSTAAGSVPDIMDLKTLKPNYCNQPSSFSLEWTYRNPSNVNQVQYNIQVAAAVDFNIPANIVVDVTSPQAVIPDAITHIGTGTTAFVIVPVPTIPIDNLEVGYGGIAYYWRLRVQDANGIWSNWVEYNDPAATIATDGDADPKTFTTETHMWPTVAFTPPAPDAYLVNQEIQFTNNSLCYGTPTDCTWSWDFDFVASDVTEPSADSTVKNPTHAYETEGDHYILLKVTDIDGHFCSNSGTSKRLSTVRPKWKEVVPR